MKKILTLLILAASVTLAFASSIVTPAGTPGTSGLATNSTIVSVGAASAPSAGQVLTATGSTSATWQTPSIPVSGITGVLPIANGGTGHSDGIASLNLTGAVNSAATVGGTADAITLTLPTPITSYASNIGLRGTFVASGTNTVSPPTIAISGLAALNTTMGGIAIPIGGLISGDKYNWYIESATSIDISPWDAVSSHGDTITGVLTSTVATGTAPFIVASSTIIPNMTTGGNALLAGSASQDFSVKTLTATQTISSLDGTIPHSSLWSSATDSLLLANNSANNIRLLSIGSSVGARLVLEGANGTLAAPTASADGNTLSSIDMIGYDGTTRYTAARIRGVVDGAVSSGNVPGGVVISTYRSGVATDRVSLSNNGNLAITGSTTQTGSVKIQALGTPATPTGIPSITGGAMAAGSTYVANIVALDAIGKTVGAQSASVTIASGTTGSIAWSWTATTGAASYQIWVSDTVATPTHYYTSTTNSYLQTQQAASGTSGTMPTINTTGTVNAARFTNSLGNVLLNSTAPTIASGFGSSPSIAANNGTAAFTVNVGTGGSASSGVITMPPAATGWACQVSPNGAPQAAGVTYSAPTSTTSITLTNYTASTGIALAWSASYVLQVTCIGY